MSRNLGTPYRGGVLARRRAGAQICYRIENAQVQALCLALTNPHRETVTGQAAVVAGR